MRDQSPSDDQISRAVDEHRTRALQRLDRDAATAVTKALAGCSPQRSRAVANLARMLARMLARDLTPIGLSSQRTVDAILGGVWLAVAPDIAGIVVAWTQHDASVAVLGVPMHDEIQRIFDIGRSRHADRLKADQLADVPSSLSGLHTLAPTTSNSGRWSASFMAVPPTWPGPQTIRR